MTNICPTREKRTARQNALLENRPIVNTDLVWDLNKKITCRKLAFGPGSPDNVLTYR
jgi:hypothetical protein